MLYTVILVLVSIASSIARTEMLPSPQLSPGVTITSGLPKATLPSCPDPSSIGIVTTSMTKAQIEDAAAIKFGEDSFATIQRRVGRVGFHMVCMEYWGRDVLARKYGGTYCDERGRWRPVWNQILIAECGRTANQ